MQKRLYVISQITGKLVLAGIRERVRLLGGNLEIKSEPDKGTTVIVEAPI